MKCDYKVLASSSIIHMCVFHVPFLIYQKLSSLATLGTMYITTTTTLVTFIIPF